MEKDHSFWGGGVFSQSQLSGAAKQSEPSLVGSWALYAFALQMSPFVKKQEVHGFKSMGTLSLQNGS